MNKYLIKCDKTYSLIFISNMNISVNFIIIYNR